MKNYYRYLPTSEEDEKWGLWVLNAGSGRINRLEDYPHADHPVHHYFNWKNGRVLQEYQLIYITRGEGSFESANCKKTTVGEGTVLLLFPGEWHRYRPDAATGWDEYWVGFNGQIMQGLVARGMFYPEKPFLKIGYNDPMVRLFDEILDNTREERASYQPTIAGAVMHLLGSAYSAARQLQFQRQDMVELTVSRARLLLRENICNDMPVERIAEELQVGYSWFRKAFKAYTGMAPGQYLIQLRIEKSKELLTGTALSIKEVAYELNFDSSFYFSRLFKEKTGMTPNQYRRLFYK